MFVKSSLGVLIRGFVGVFAFASAWAASPSVTYHGRLVKPDGTAVDSSHVIFRVRIYSPGSEKCLFYDEKYLRDLSVSNGEFAIVIGDGTASVVNTEPFTLDRLFQNRGTFSFSAGKCTSGTTYVPGATDGRAIQISFDDGSGFEDVPEQTISQVPQALEAVTVGGYTGSQLFRVVDGSGNPVAMTAWTSADYTKLTDLVAGSSSQYRASAAPVVGADVSGNISGNAAGFTGSLSGDVSGTQGATSVDKIKGRDVSSTAPTSGQVLTWNNSTSKWEPATPSGGGGSVTSVTASAPLASSGGATPNLTITQASTSTNGYLSSTDWNTFNGKQATLGFTPVNKAGDTMTGSLTVPANGLTVGTNQLVASGGFVGIGTTTPNALLDVNGTMRVTQICDSTGANCKTVSGGWGSGGSVTSVGLTVPSIMSVSGGPVTTSGTLAVSLASQSAKTVFAGPTSGSAAPAFRSLNIGDIQSTNTGAFLTGGACGSGQALVYNSPADTISCATISLTSAQVTSALTYTPVNKAGDTMSGALNLPANGLVLGTNQLVASGGSVGIGTATPGGTLHVLSTSTSAPGLIAQAIAGQTSQVFSVNDSTNNPRFTVDAAGTVTVSGTAASGQNAVNIQGGTVPSILSVGGNSILCYSPLGGNCDATSSATDLILRNYSNNIMIVPKNDLIINTGFPASAEKVRVTAAGNVGIGTTTPSAKLQVNGQAVGGVYDAGSGTSFDWNNGNAQYTSASCGAMTFTNMLDGGAYTLGVNGATSGTCTFSQSGLTFVWTYQGPTTASTKSLFSFQRLGSTVYVNWSTGYQ